MSTALAYVRDGESAPPVDAQLVAIQRRARELRLDLAGVAKDHNLGTPINGMTHTLGGIVTVLDEARRESVLMVWDRARLRPPGWMGRPADEVLERRGLKIVEVASEGSLRGSPAPVPELRRSSHPIDPLGPETTPSRARRHQRKPELTPEQKRVASRRATVKSGIPSGITPYGYSRVEQRLVPDPVESVVVRRVFSEYLAPGGSLKKVGESLARDAILPRRGAAWSRAGLSHVLKNRTYLGQVHYGETRSPMGTHAALVSPIVFNKAQKKLREKTKNGRLAAPPT